MIVLCCSCQFHRAVRILEGVKDKTQDEGLYQSIVAQLKPTIDELGVSTPEELGLAGKGK